MTAPLPERLNDLRLRLTNPYESKDAATVAEAIAALAEREKDAERYRWLRDKSVPPHNFYISVPDEFKDERYQPKQVDEYIDAAIAAIKEGK